MAVHYAVWNSSDKDADISVSGGNLTASTTTDAAWGGIRSNISKSTGKWYFEYHIDSGNTNMISGVSDATAGVTNVYLGQDTHGWGYYHNDGTKVNNNSFTAYGAALANGDVIGVALDADAGSVTYYKNNSSQGAITLTGLTAPYFAHFSGIKSGATDQVVTANFGATSLTYTPPGGYNAGLYTTIVEGDVAGWWDCQEGSGTNVNDESSGAHDAAINGADWVTGGPTNLPNGLDFIPANDDYCLVTNDYDLSAATVCVWVKVDDFCVTDNTEAVIVGNGDLGGELDLMTTQRDATDDFRGRTHWGSPGADQDVDANSKSTATLYHVAYGYESTGHTNEIWVNGVSAATGSGGSGTIADSGHNLYWGRRSDGTATKEYDGKIYQVVLFNRKLTLAEVQAIYNAGVGKTYAQEFPLPTVSVNDTATITENVNITQVYNISPNTDLVRGLKIIG